MIHKRIELVKGLGLVVLTFFDHRFVSLGQNKAGISPGIVNKKKRFLWDNPITLSFYVRFIAYVISLFLNLKLSWSLFLAKIYNKVSRNRFRRRATPTLQRVSISPNIAEKSKYNLKVLGDGDVLYGKKEEFFYRLQSTLIKNNKKEIEKD